MLHKWLFSASYCVLCHFVIRYLQVSKRRLNDVGCGGGGDLARKIRPLDDGPIVDEFEQCVRAGIPDGALLERMAWVLDMPTRCLEVLHLDRLAVLKVVG